MRKLVILCLAVGLALASSSQWVGPSRNLCYPIPNPQPGIFPFTPEVFRPALDTLKYDDNVAANAWCQNVGGGGWGMKFISPSDNVTLSGALVNFYAGWPVPGGTKALVRVYADDGINGAPGTELWASDTVTIVMGQWNLVPISVPVVASNFYIFYVQVGNNPNCPGLSIDANNNSPGGRKWSYGAGGVFTEDATRGDWLIRAVVDWTPQDVNASMVQFATNLPKDTLPNINFQIKGVLKNMGNNPLPVGTPVRLHITGPNSYVFQDTMLTTAVINRGATAQMNFSPAWRIPNQPGSYDIKVWSEAAGENWPANDTITYELGVAKWIEYFVEANMHWLTWAGPLRAVRFNPVDFAIPYPVGLSRVRADFYLTPQYPWPDSSYLIDIYGDDGETMIYQSDTIEAKPGTPGPWTACDLDSMLIFPSGVFYVAIEPVSSSGHPSTVADSSEVGGHSYAGVPGSWTVWSPGSGMAGEFFISAAVQGNVGIEEGFEPGVHTPNLRISNYPNPVIDQVTIKWQVPRSMPVSVNLYDATGRMVRNLFTANDKPRVGVLSVDTRSLASGIYLVRLETPKGTATRKLVIDR